jgi:hypothetical protein
VIKFDFDKVITLCKNIEEVALPMDSIIFMDFDEVIFDNIGREVSFR